MQPAVEGRPVARHTSLTVRVICFGAIDRGGWTCVTPAQLIAITLFSLRISSA